MSNLLVSVIVPIYNGEMFLDKCVLSIIHQSYTDIEIILVDDGSTDSSGKMCDNYASLDSRVRVIHKENGGLVSSRKAGLKASTGYYILYVDGDDWIETNLIKDYMICVQKFNVDVVVSSHIVNLEGSVKFLKNSIPPGIYLKDDLLSTVYPKMLYTGKFSQFGIFSYSWGKLFKRSILLDNQLKVSEDITMGEDALCLYPTLLDANTVAILDQPYYHYRQRADSLTKILRTVDVSKMIKVYQGLKQAFDDRGFSELMLPQLQQYFLSLLTINTEGPDKRSVLDIYPFGKFSSSKSLVICGGGTFGQHLYKKISKYNNHKIAAWIDERHEHYSKLGLPVLGFETIKSIDYDLVLIALIDEDNSNQARLELINQGVDASKIIQITHYNKKNIEKHLLEYKITI